MHGYLEEKERCKQRNKKQEQASKLRTKHKYDTLINPAVKR
jgi:hypothetical protein